jgi:hypothetical protein
MLFLRKPEKKRKKGKLIENASSWLNNMVMVMHFCPDVMGLH